MTTANRRVVRAELRRTYARASWYYADHLARAGKRALRQIVERRAPVNFSRLA
jgi:hypothetical protein